ncbi:MAG: hypothetical protein ACJA2E_002463 [Arenicella sp.]|jgi:hypothetical protein
MSTILSPQPRSQTSQLKEVLIFGILGALLAYGISAALDKDPSLRLKFKQTVADYVQQGCNLTQESLSINLCDSVSTTKYWEDELSRLPSQKAAFDSINWTYGDEKTALKYTAIIRGIQQARWPDDGTQTPWTLARDALQPIFDAYPKIAVGSQCYWCQNHDSNMYEWFTASRKHDDYLGSLIETTPHLFGQFSDTLGVSGQRKLSLAQNQAYLGFHGNRYGFLGGVLYANGDKEYLHHLVRNTGSAAPIMGLNWDTIDIETVKLSWERGVKVGDDLPQFTEYLLSRGHRPALRWAIWVSTEAENSPHLGRMRRVIPAYKELLEKHTNFYIPKGQRIDEFYSQNWQRIKWNVVNKHWQLGG